MSWSNSNLVGRREREQVSEREREIGGTREEPLDGATGDLSTHVHQREGPPWLSMGRVEREGVERAAPTMAGKAVARTIGFGLLFEAWKDLNCWL
jgi:hypothetical protein